MLSQATYGLHFEKVFEPIYNDILYRSVVFDAPEGKAAIAALFDFHELPANIDKLLKVLSEEETAAGIVANVAELNPAVAAKILKVVNSSFAGLRCKISSLKRAVTLLGNENIRAMILGMSMFTQSRARIMPKELSLIDLWKHSAAVSRIASIIAGKLSGIDGATLVSAGLLHDAGKVVMASAFKDRFTRALKAAAERKGELLAIELKYFGLSHPLLATALCYWWNLPEKLWGLIAAQEHPALGPDGRTAAVLTLAEFFARSYGIGSDGQWAHGFVPEEVCWHLSLTQDAASHIIGPEEIRGVVDLVDVIAKWE